MYIKVSSVHVFCLILYQGDHHRLVNYSTYVFSIHIWCMEQHVSLWCCTWYGKEVNSENPSTGSLHMSILGLFNLNAVMQMLHIQCFYQIHDLFIMCEHHKTGKAWLLAPDCCPDCLRGFELFRWHGVYVYHSWSGWPPMLLL